MGLAETSASARAAARYTSAVTRGLRESAIIALGIVALVLLIALLTYSPDDPGFSFTGNSAPVRNRIGVIGAWLADVLFFLFGRPAFLFPFRPHATLQAPARRPQHQPHPALVARRRAVFSLRAPGVPVPAGAGGGVLGPAASHEDGRGLARQHPGAHRGVRAGAGGELRAHDAALAARGTAADGRRRGGERGGRGPGW